MSNVSTLHNEFLVELKVQPEGGSRFQLVSHVFWQKNQSGFLSWRKLEDLLKEEGWFDFSLYRPVIHTRDHGVNSILAQYTGRTCGEILIEGWCVANAVWANEHGEASGIKLWRYLEPEDIKQNKVLSVSAQPITTG